MQTHYRATSTIALVLAAVSLLLDDWRFVAWFLGLAAYFRLCQIADQGDE